MHGADHPGLVIVHVVPAKSSGETLPPHLDDEGLVRVPEAGEVASGGERLGALDARDEQRVRPVATLDVDREAEVHVLVTYDGRLVVLDRNARVEVGEVGERAHDRVGDEVGEAHLAFAGACELVVEDLAVDLEQLGRDHPHRGGGGYPETRFHVLDRAHRSAAQDLGLVALEQHRPRAHGAGRAGAAGRRAVGCGGRPANDGPLKYARHWASTELGLVR